MLSATSIFRRMPGALPVSARRLFGALAYAHDAAELSFFRLKDAARAYRFPEDGMSHEAAGWSPGNRLGVIADAWACIDNLNRTRNLVQKFKVGAPPPPEIVLFVSAMDPAARIRSRLQRLDEDIFEGRSSEEGDPVLGTVSWSDTRGSKGPARFSIASGAILEGGLMTATPVSGAPQAGDIVDVQLAVAEQTVHLDALMDALADFMPRFEERVSRATLSALHSAAQAQGVPVDQPEPHGPADITTAVRIHDLINAGLSPNPGDVKMLAEVPPGTFDMRAI